MGTAVPAPLARYRDAQLLSACAFGIWWVLLSPAVLATIGAKGVGGARIAYNAALFVVSPAAGGAVERGDVLRLLSRASAGRVVVYALAPLLWALVRQYDAWDRYYAPAFFALMAVDGVFVALVNVASIDCGGTDLVATRLGLGGDVTDELRDRFNALHQLALDGSMVVGAPAVALACFFVGMRGARNQSLALLAALGATIFVCFGGSVVLYGYVAATSKEAPARAAEVEAGEEVAKAAPCCGGPCGAVAAALRALPADFGYVASLDARLLWRVFFLAVDTAVEDAVVAVVLPSLANQLACRPHEVATTGDAYAAHCEGEWRLRGGAFLAVFVAIGKLGGVAAGALSHGTAEANMARGDAHYRSLFKCALFAGLTFLAVPAVALEADLGRDATYALLCVAVFCFFFLMTLPKIGFATLLQHMACASDAPGRVFGFTASLVMIVDSLVVAGLSLCAPSPSFKLATSLWISAGFVAGVGVLEGTFGPRLVLGEDRAGGGDVGRVSLGGDADGAALDTAQPLINS